MLDLIKLETFLLVHTQQWLRMTLVFATPARNQKLLLALQVENIPGRLRGIYAMLWIKL